MPAERPAPFAQVDPYRAGHAARADPEMAIKPLVLGRHHGVLEMLADGLGRDLAAELIPAPGKHVTLPVQQGHRPTRPPVEQFGQIRQRCVDISDRQADHHGNNRGHPPGDPPHDPQEPADDTQEKRHDRVALACRCPPLALGRRLAPGRRLRLGFALAIAFFSHQRRLFSTGFTHACPARTHLFWRTLPCYGINVDPRSRGIAPFLDLLNFHASLNFCTNFPQRPRNFSVPPRSNLSLQRRINSPLAHWKHVSDRAPIKGEPR